MLDASLATATAEEECAMRTCVRQASQVLKSATSKAGMDAWTAEEKRNEWNKTDSHVSARKANYTGASSAKSGTGAVWRPADTTGATPRFKPRTAM